MEKEILKNEQLELGPVNEEKEETEETEEIVESDKEDTEINELAVVDEKKKRI